MSRRRESTTRHALWRRSYRALLVLLPSTLREKHGVVMSELYARELERTEAHGQGAVWRVAVSGMADLIGRGVYERVVEERAALAGPNRQHLRDLGSAYAVALVALTTAMLALYARSGWARWRMREIPIATAFEYVMLAIPFTAALTIPMAVFVAVLCTGTRAAANGRSPSLTTVPSGTKHWIFIRKTPACCALVGAVICTNLLARSSPEVVTATRNDPRFATTVPVSDSVPPLSRAYSHAADEASSTTVTEVMTPDRDISVGALVNEWWEGSAAAKLWDGLLIFAPYVSKT